MHTSTRDGSLLQMIFHTLFAHTAQRNEQTGQRPSYLQQVGDLSSVGSIYTVQLQHGSTNELQRRGFLRLIIIVSKGRLSLLLALRGTVCLSLKEG